MTTIAVTGSRHVTNATEAVVTSTLDTVSAWFVDPISVAVGDATGVDAITAAWCRANGVHYTVHRADWDSLGRAAGPLRNQRMLDASRPDLLVAFPGGRGTRDCTTRAMMMYIPVLAIPALRESNLRLTTVQAKVMVV